MTTSKKEFILSHVFENVSKMKEGEKVYNPDERHFDTIWNIGLARKGEQVHALVIVDDKSEEYTIETEIKTIIISPNGRNMSKKDECTFNSSNDSGYGYEFFSWKKLLEDYLVDGKLTVEVHVKILKMTGIKRYNLRCFDESMKEFSDVVLVAGKKKFYVSKLFLASHSSYFKSLLLGNFVESKKSEIELKEINSRGFQCFLEVLHGEDAIDDDTVEGILHLADMYDAPTAHRRCEQFLMKESEKSLKEKLESSFSPTLEDIDLIDVLWRSDFAGEKGTPTVERALMTLTEKSSAGPLNQEERDAYEGLSLNLYEGFYGHQKAHPEQVKLHTLEQHCSHDESEDDLPIDNDFEELLKDVSREDSELNKVFENTNPVLNNISLSEGIVYTQSNLTEMQELQDSCNQVNCTASSVVSSSQAASLFNDTDAQTRERWQDADMVHTDLFQPPHYVYVGMTNDTPEATVSNGQVGYDHAYSSSVQPSLSPLNLARSSNGRQQLTQTSPGSATVTATATHSRFESHYTK